MLSSSRTERYLREAERRGNIALSLAPDDPDALNAIALTELKFGNEVDASRYLARSLDKFPKHLRSTMALAVIKLSRKDAAGAEEVLRTAVTEAPHAARPLVALGELYLMTHKNPEATHTLQRALEIDPKNEQALLHMAELLSRKGQGPEAEEAYRRLSALPNKEYRSLHALYPHRSFVDRFVQIGGGGGNSTLGGPYGLTPVFGTGDFSNSSTPPHTKLGAPLRNRTAHTEVAPRPLATCCCGAWHLGGDSNTQSRVWSSPHHRQPGEWCARLDFEPALDRF